MVLKGLNAFIRVEEELKAQKLHFKYFAKCTNWLHLSLSAVGGLMQNSREQFSLGYRCSIVSKLGKHGHS